MAQTFTNYDDIPGSIQEKIEKMVSGGKLKTVSTRIPGVSLYKLEEYPLEEYLTIQQKAKLFDILLRENDILNTLRFEFEPITIDVIGEAYVYLVPTNVSGTFNGLDGLLLEDGSIHM
jgi:hypothetical protein